MKKQKLICALFTLLLPLFVQASLNIDSSRRYYITCDYTTGYVALGSQHDVTYPLYYNSELTEDAYWTITGDSTGYVFQNCQSGQYLSWSSDYDNDRYLNVTDTVTGDEQRWLLLDGDGYFIIQNVAQPSFAFNLRTGTMQLGTYSGSSSNANSHFHLFDSDGNEVVEASQLVEGITLSVNTVHLSLGNTIQLTATITPDNADDKSLTWSSSDVGIATVSSTGLVTSQSAGRATITVSANDGSGVSAQCVVNITDGFVEHSDDMLYVRNSTGGMTIIPHDFISDYHFSGSLFTANLTDGAEITLTKIIDVSSEIPTDLPAFSSYKFNNKFNDQLFTDAIAENPAADSLHLTVGCIGKWLTASFKFPEEGMRAYVGDVRQRSKVTRQSFANPITYHLTRDGWQQLEMAEDIDGNLVHEYVDYNRKVVVNVDFLTDNPTSVYGVPRIDIYFNDSIAWSSKSWIGMNGKRTYEEATITIDGGGVYPNMASTPILIKGRGNSSWSNSYTSKNPYHFKFSTKQKPLGMTSGKHWILLSNKQTGSMTTNAVGMKVANLMGVAGANHIVPVELYVNGSYRGSYNLTERLGFSNNSIDLMDESYAAMIELDSYTDETQYYSNAYYLPAKIHEPDVEEDTIITAEQIISDFDAMMLDVWNRDYTHRLEPLYAARYLAANEFIANCELKHPKSVFLYSENVTDGFNLAGDDETPWIFGPLWDCDWAFGYQQQSSYYQVVDTDDFFGSLISGGSSNGRAQQFWNALRYGSEEVDQEYYILWDKMMNNGGLAELVDFCDDYYDYAARSLFHNRTNATNNRDGSSYETITENAKKWLQSRANYIFSTLTPYDIPEEQDEDDTNPIDHMGDVNDDLAITAADVVCVLNDIVNLPNETYIKARADMNSNGSVTIGDVVEICNLVMEQPANARRQLHLPMSSGALHLSSITTEAQSKVEMPIRLTIDEGYYSALQMDIQLPDGVELDGVNLPSELAGMTAQSRMLEDGRYRVIIYSDGSHVMPESVTTVRLRLMTSDPVQGYVNITGATLSTNEGEEERIPSRSCVLTVSETSTDGIMAAESVTGQGSGVVYDLSGRRVNRASHGIYIVNGKKVVK